ncbi:MAG: hypothetical protein GXO86_00760 [Chlorobi bacterium]|nr:hypothetical protein [Chlorobiota bacterium]
MKFFKTIFFLFVFLSIFFSCRKDDTVVDDKVPPPVNTPPKLPEVTLLKLTYNSATISCGKAIDADNDTLYYSLYLKDSLILSSVSGDILYKFENLKPETFYEGKITVTDSVNEPVSSGFSFTTLKYKTLFSKIYNNPGGGIAGKSLAKTADGGYVVFGTINQESRFMFILKVDSLGYEQWSRIYDIKIHELYGEIIKTVQNNFVLVIDNNIIKIDDQGNILWHFVAEKKNYYYSVIESDGELLITGLINLSASLTKLTLNGEKLWERTYYDPYERDAGSICKSHDGNYVILGTAKVDDKRNFWILKADNEGNMIWDRIYESPFYDFTEQIVLTNDNGFIIAGNSLASQNVNMARVFKTDENGNLIWDRTFKWDRFKTYARGVTQTPDGSYVFCGSAGYTPQKSLLVKLDASGEVIWKQFYKPPDYIIDYIWRFGEVKVCSDDGFILLGGKSWVEFGYPGQEKGLWIMKTDEYGNYE